jgi:outer membrane protein assembly factor BamB
MRGRQVSSLLLFAGTLLCSLASVGRADNWPSWRGPTQDGISKETNLPAKWSKSENIAWTTPLPGMGSSTPAVWGKRIFLTSEDGNDIVLLCLDTDGKQLWKTVLGSAPPKRFMRGEANLASSSPCTDGKHVYAFCGTGDFACCDFEGKVLWTFNAQKRYGQFQIQHGMHITPVLDGDRLYLSLLHSGGWWVMALDKKNGQEIWRVRRESDATDECEQAYASPVLWKNGKDKYIVVLGCDYATAHSVKDGAEIWRVGDLNPKRRYNPAFRIIATPAASADLIVVPSARDGPVIGVKPGARGRVTPGSSSEQWRLRGKGPGPLSKTPDVPAPLIHDGLVYICREYTSRELGALICIDAKTGEERYYEKVHPSRYRASPVYGDGNIYLAARDGMVTVVKAGPKFETLATNRMPDEITASPAIADGRIYIRGFKALYAISEGGK